MYGRPVKSLGSLHSPHAGLAYPASDPLLAFNMPIILKRLNATTCATFIVSQCSCIAMPMPLSVLRIPAFITKVDVRRLSTSPDLRPFRLEIDVACEQGALDPV
jgi:hypothetical protein